MPASLPLLPYFATPLVPLTSSKMGFNAPFVSEPEPDTMAESGYASGSSSESSIPEIFFSKPHLEFLNRQLQFLEPEGTSSNS